MSWILLMLITVTICVFISLYFGIWSQTLKEFSDESVRNTLKFTSRLQDYEAARYNTKEITMPRLAFIKDTERFSERQREIIHEILERSRKRLVILGVPLLCLVGLSTIYISHKIAGPHYHFGKAFKELQNKNLRIRVKLRKYDEAKKLSEIFNQSVGELDRSVAKMKRILGDNQEPSKVRNDLSKELSQFKTTED